jgi:hypothetical protein
MDEVSLWYDKNIEEARRALLTYYTSLQSSQTTRLIGFVAGLFTLLQLTQVSKSLTLHTMFSSFPIIINFPVIVWEAIRFVTLFGGIFIIIFFILRAIFRFCIFGLLSSAVANLSEEDYDTVLKDIGNVAEKKGPIQLMKIVASWKVVVKDNRKAYGVLPAKLFVQFNHKEYKTPKYWGAFWLALLSFIITILILAILW